MKKINQKKFCLNSFISPLTLDWKNYSPSFFKQFVKIFLERFQEIVRPDSRDFSLNNSKKFFFSFFRFFWWLSVIGKKTWMNTWTKMIECNCLLTNYLFLLQLSFSTASFLVENKLTNVVFSPYLRINFKNDFC